MTDNFALLNAPRLPWIDTDLLKENFITLSTRMHPDRVHQLSETERKDAGARFAELNAAYNCLREPKERLRHLLELELGKKPGPVQNIPPEMMESFFEVTSACKEADVFLAEKAKVASTIMKVRLFERSQEWTDRLTVLQRKINSRLEELAIELKAMNPAWEKAVAAEGTGKQAVLARVEDIYRLLGYFGRWAEQIQERILQLML